MKRTLPILLLVFCFFCCREKTYGQGWAWANTNNSAFLDGWPVATDQYGNVYAGAMTYNIDYTPITFDSLEIPFSIDLLGNQSVVAKFDTGGAFLWAVSTQKGDTHLLGITTDPSGNMIMFCSLTSDSVQINNTVLKNPVSPATEYFLVKFDPNANVLWARIEGGGPNNIGPAGTVFGQGQVTTDSKGNIYITTSFQQPAITISSQVIANACPGCNTDDILLAKYDASGNVLWATSAGGQGDDEAYGLALTPAGSIYISGIYTSPNLTFGQSVITNALGNWNGYIAQFDANGNALWASGSGGTGGAVSDVATGIAADATGNVYLTGWVTDSSIAYAGATITNPYPGHLSEYLVKFNPENEVSWTKTMGCPKGGNALGYAVAVSPCGVWVAGAVNNTVEIDGNTLDTPADSRDPVFIAGFKPDGTYLGSDALPTGGDDQIGVTCDRKGNVFLCADNKKLMPFTVGRKTIIHTDDKTEQLYVAKYVPVDQTAGDNLYTKEDTTICLFSDPIIYAPAGYERYMWDNGSTKQSREAKEPGDYWVTCYGGCTVTDTITVYNNNDLCGCIAAMPKAFTPNGDGKNDTYGPLFQRGCNVSDYSFTIVNRWGQKVFSTTDPGGKWDGTYWYINADLGVYQYYLRYRSGADNVQYHFDGDVTLIR